MAKKSSGSVNKSELIRAYIAEFPEKKPKEVAEFISAQIKEPVSAQFVSTVKANAKKKGGKVGKRGRKARATAADITAAIDTVVGHAKQQEYDHAGYVELAEIFVNGLGPHGALRLLQAVIRIKTGG